MFGMIANAFATRLSVPGRLRAIRRTRIGRGPQRALLFLSVGFMGLRRRHRPSELKWLLAIRWEASRAHRVSRGHKSRRVALACVVMSVLCRLRVCKIQCTAMFDMFGWTHIPPGQDE